MFLLVTCIVGNKPQPIDYISRSNALKALMLCIPYLNGAKPTPTRPCCLAVEKVKELANTTEERRELCERFKKAAPGLGV
ncbi:hypothetical protein NL676_013239 [Syzygium grande]|nr:hypothetical protein NL676_013239 [Syzygium grande]